jgi:hypothetical protein
MNQTAAPHYYKLSADQGDAMSQSNYGWCLDYGEGVAMDKVFAAHYYKLSADQGNMMGQSRTHSPVGYPNPHSVASFARVFAPLARIGGFDDRSTKTRNTQNRSPTASRPLKKKPQASAFSRRIGQQSAIFIAPLASEAMRNRRASAIPTTAFAFAVEAHHSDPAETTSATCSRSENPRHSKRKPIGAKINGRGRFHITLSNRHCSIPSFT